MTTAAIVEIQNLTCSLGEQVVLRDVSLTLDRQSITSLIGQNGSGKTTLLRCLLKLQDCTGTIAVDGQPLAGFSRKALAEKIAYVPQHYNLKVPFSVREFLLLSRYAFRAPFSSAGPQDFAAVDLALDDTGITAFAGRRVSTLSGGEQQRVIVASALVQGAQVLLLDEPGNHLDPRYREELFTLLMQLKTLRGLTILAVHHDINQAVLMSERVVALRSGSVV